MRRTRSCIDVIIWKVWSSKWQSLTTDSAELYTFGRYICAIKNQNMDGTNSLEIGMSSGIGSSNGDGNAESTKDKNQEEREMEKKFTGFAVPLYLQRYIAVKEILVKHKISRVCFVFCMFVY